MKRSIGASSLLGFSVTALGGTILHFLYEWLGESPCVAPFSGVNESTWEHMKLLFWPMLAFAVFERIFFPREEVFWCVKLRAILLGLSMIPLIFYVYNGVIGKSPDFINIAIFFISAAVAYIYEFRARKAKDTPCGAPRIALSLLFCLAALFIIFTFFTPQIEIFRDPLTGKFGIL